MTSKDITPSKALDAVKAEQKRLQNREAYRKRRAALESDPDALAAFRAKQAKYMRDKKVTTRYYRATKDDPERKRKRAEWAAACYARNREDRRLRDNARRYRISKEEYAALRKKPCEICGTYEEPQPGKRSGGMHIDHDHETGKIRGVLCSNCNLTLGKFKDSPQRFEKAAEYLRRYGRT